MVYYLPLQFLELGLNGGLCHPRRIFRTLLFITNTPYWFIRTYLFLYLVSPILNSFLEKNEQKKTNLMLLLLAVISIYFGTMQGDDSLYNGKNLTNFVFLYFLGHTVHYYLPQWKKMKIIYVLATYVLLNILIILLLLRFPRDTSIGDLIWRLSCPYCSPILIFNALLVFVFFSKLNIRSRIINYLSASVFAVYLIHCQPVIHKYVILEACERMISSPNNALAITVVMSMVILVASIGIDKILTPLWNIANRRLSKLSSR